MKRYQVITIGGATRDVFFYTGEGFIIKNPKDITRQKLLGFEYGAKIISRDVYFDLGGGACNAAVSFSRLGLPVATFVCIGQDREGEAIIKDLTKERVDTQFICYHEQISTGFSFITITQRTHDHVAFLYRGANDYLKFDPAKFSRLNTQWFYITSLSGDQWPTILNQVFSKARTKKIKVAWNPGSKQLSSGYQGLKKFIKNTDIIFLNKDEATELVISYIKCDVAKSGCRNKVKDIKFLLNEIYNWGPEIVVITNGKKGAYAFDGQEVHYARIKAAKTVDTTGAGDCFNSSFLTGMIKFRGDIEKSLKLGIINTASLVTKVGAQKGLLKWKEAGRKI